MTKLAKCDRCGEIVSDLEVVTVKSGLFLENGYLRPVDLCRACTAEARQLLAEWLAAGAPKQVAA